MSEFLTYSLRTGACIAVFYLFFKLLLSRETFHAFNRALVLAATAVSFVLPLCVITVQRTLPARETVSTSDEYPYPAYADIVTPAADTPTDAPAGGSLSAARVMAASATPLSEETVAPESEETVMPEPEGMVTPLTEEDILSDHASAESVAAVQPSVSEAVETSRGVEIPWRQIGIVIYLAGVAAVIFVTVRSIVGLHRLMRRGRCERLDDGTTLVRMDENVAPISWCRNIVISERDLRENGAAILAHERAHVRLHHSLDLLLVDLAGAVQWFNPAMWLLRRDLRAIHEYEADAAVIASGVDARSYQLLLIRKAVGGRWYSIANSFNHSKLKNRITMMLREKSSRRTRARALLLVERRGGPDALDRVLEHLCWLSARLTQQGVSHTVLWPGENGVVHTALVDEAGQLDALLYRLLAEPADGADGWAPGWAPPQAEWSYTLRVEKEAADDAG